MYSIGIAAMLLGVCIKTLRRWDKNKKIIYIRTEGGQRRFSIKEIRMILNNSKEKKKMGKTLKRSQVLFKTQ
ncbi:MAG: MerR family DNA-binding transcriptional regulator [Promethearchaeota archaeon]